MSKCSNFPEALQNKAFSYNSKNLLYNLRNVGKTATIVCFALKLSSSYQNLFLQQQAPTMKTMMGLVIGQS